LLRKPNSQTEEAKKKTKGSKAVPSIGAIGYGGGYVGQGYPVSTTLPRHHSPSSSEDSVPKEQSVTCIVYYEDADFPYQLKVPSRGGFINLSSFKDVLPKRGNFRYFFKRECSEQDIKVVQEEVIEDSQVGQAS